MASPVVQTSSGNTGDSATPTLVEPSGAVLDDLLVAIIGSGDPGTAITGLTGWTQLGEGSDSVGNRYWYGYIIRGASAPDLAAAAANENWTAMCYRIDGHDATNPIGASDADHGINSATTINPDPPSVDTGTSDDYLALAAALSEGKHTGWTPPSGYAEDQESNTGGGGSQTIHVGGTIASLGLTTQTVNPGTFLASRSDGSTAFTIVVSPDPAAGDIITGDGIGHGVAQSLVADDLLIIADAVGHGQP